MELNTILELVKAGFTKDEINALAQNTTPNVNVPPVQEPVNEPVPEPEPTPVPEPVVEPVTAPKPVHTSKPEEPTMSELMQSIARLTSAVQANAIAQSVIPGGIPNAPSAEDMLAEIIRPTYKERG